MIIVGEIQISTATRDQPAQVRAAKIKTQATTSAGEGVEKTELSCAVGGNAAWCSHCGEQYGASSKS